MFPSLPPLSPRNQQPSNQVSREIPSSSLPLPLIAREPAPQGRKESHSFWDQKKAEQLTMEMDRERQELQLGNSDSSRKFVCKKLPYFPKNKAPSTGGFSVDERITFVNEPLSQRREPAPSPRSRNPSLPVLSKRSQPQPASSSALFVDSDEEENYASKDGYEGDSESGRPVEFLPITEHPDWL